MSQPAATAEGTNWGRGIAICMPAIIEASVTTRPLKPSRSRSRVVVISYASEAGSASW